MKISKRPMPMDALCVEEKGYKLRILTHRNKLVVNIEEDGRLMYDEWLTMKQLISLLMRDPAAMLPRPH